MYDCLSTVFCQYCLDYQKNMVNLDSNIELKDGTIMKIYELCNIFSDDKGVFRECQEGSVVCSSCVTQLLSTHQFYQKCVSTRELLKINQKMNEEIKRQSDFFSNPIELSRAVSNATNNQKTDLKNESNQMLSLKEHIFPTVHIKEEPNDFLNFTCAKCNDLTFDKQSDLLLHLAENHQVDCIVCETCGAVFNKTIDSDSHRLKHYLDNSFKSSFDCETCGAKFPSPIALEKHVRSHTAEIYCLICYNTFKKMQHLKQHLGLHIEQKSLSCTYCPLKFVLSVQLNAHIKQSHSPSRLKRISCDKNGCKGRFATKDQLKQHIDDVHSQDTRKDFVCKICSKGFQSKSHLAEHMDLHLYVVTSSKSVTSKVFSRLG